MKVNLSKTIVVRTTDDQFKQMKANAKELGFTTFSDYIRFVALNATCSVTINTKETNVTDN